VRHDLVTAYRRARYAALPEHVHAATETVSAIDQVAPIGRDRYRPNNANAEAAFS
jgi:hypothetical protein